ncbi:hypothetical protein RFI_26521 [Reticulomyxa filosa]|uniref:MPN domain-containing protein n=1 Tax=Reticulomyxa filosa TaxID=46433 RepID=X6MBM7_RETFI|nr:hypothetical protein RFI_26521 [Reticulomyxa filosa]|eukprot:ETO10857.1 hypothetical protein RFI_26521 [Reticulomyxa filosa]
MSTNNDQLFFNTRTAQYKLSPLVVLSILNHFQRRTDKSPSPELDTCDFVVGLLFGAKEKSCVRVTSSFPLCVYQTKKVNSMSQRKQLYTYMYIYNIYIYMYISVVELHSQGHSKDDKLVGWYKTGTTPEPSMHKLLQGEEVKIASKRKINSNELLQLLVDTELIDDTMRVTGYVGNAVADPLELHMASRRQAGDDAGVGVEDGSDEKQQKKNKPRKQKKSKKSSDIARSAQVEETFWKFEPVVIEYSMEKAEEIVLHTTLNTPPDHTSLDAPSTLLSDLGHLENTLQDLTDTLAKVSDFVQSAKDSNHLDHTSLGWDIAHALSAIPTIAPQAFEKALSNRLQDLLMLAYLGKLTHTQLKVADKINQVLHQTIQS